MFAFRQIEVSTGMFTFLSLVLD